jgi:hypothetical protein
MVHFSIQIILVDHACGEQTPSSPDSLTNICEADWFTMPLPGALNGTIVKYNTHDRASKDKNVGVK